MPLAPAPLRLLLVDDHPMVRMGMRIAFQHHVPELQICEAGTRKEALAALRLHKPQFVLLDVHLPDGNGLDLVRDIRAQNRKAKILMVAAEVDPWTVREALNAGASGFLGKANSGDILSEALRSIQRGEVFLCTDAQTALRRSDHCGDDCDPLPTPAILSHREREVLGYLAHGENTKSIAAALGISANTVQTHRQHIMRKLHTDNVATLTRYAIRHGLARPV